MTDYFIVEHELIDKSLKIKKRLSHLKMVKNAYGKDFSSEDATSLNELENEKESISQKLIDLSEKPVTKKKISIITNQTRAIINSLIEGPFGYKISRDQGLIYDTAIYGYIIRDIEHSLTTNYEAYHIPSYYYSSESNFDHNPIKDYLKSFVEKINSNNPANFIELNNEVEICMIEIKELCNNDYRENVLGNQK